MRFVTYQRDAEPRVGFLDGESVQDAGFDGDMVAFIDGGAPLGDVRAVSGPYRLLAPLRPRTLRDFLQFKGHLDNALVKLGREVPGEFFTVPGYYKGMVDTVIGTDATIPWPAYAERLDHELELAAVIGRRGKDIAAEEAESYIFGWTIWNDMSARDIQVRELPLGLGPAKAKDWDGSNVIGPCIATADEVDGNALDMSVAVNGEVWGSDNSSNMQHSFAELIAYASQSQTLYPGEVFGSGTAANGSGIELDRWLREGDLVEMTIEGIGTLRNHVGRRGQPS